MRASIRVVDPESVLVAAEISMTLGEWVELQKAMDAYSQQIAYSSIVYGLSRLTERVIKTARERVDVTHTEERA